MMRQPKTKPRRRRNKSTYDIAVQKIMDHVDANLMLTLNMQVRWMIRDAADAGAKFRKSRAPVEHIYITPLRTYIYYADHTGCMFKDMMGNLVPSVANENFIGYTVPDGSGPR